MLVPALACCSGCPAAVHAIAAGWLLEMAGPWNVVFHFQPTQFKPQSKLQSPAAAAVVQVLLGTDTCVYNCDEHAAQEQPLSPPAPVVRITPSPDGQFLALFTREGRMLVVSVGKPWNHQQPAFIDCVLLVSAGKLHYSAQVSIRRQAALLSTGQYCSLWPKASQEPTCH